MFQPFLIALQFLTQCPVRLGAEPNDEAIGKSVLFYPVIGFLIGLLLAALSWLLNGTPPVVAAALILICWVFITGGLHLDGLADSADAWVGGMKDRDRTLTIMKDPNCGPAGVVAIVLLLLLKFATLYTLVITDAWVILILAATLGRTILPLLFLTTPYVRPNGLGSTLVNHMPRYPSMVVIALTSLLATLTLGVNNLWLLAAIVVIFLIFRHLMLRRIGGTTGDTAGALVEITEVSVLLVAVLFAT